ncbi:carbohydrate-binding module family 48 protein [Polychaeton citri CBS 116435]|uniref:Carbohydrate-binding module family 48 protein n=1 Tax=Polychaeton citri CBS 116435 TaxID=1314669 RepID=A0A9P4UNX1_9PEZI|nr:carbohydrate-binding module family 48 protein [Polychaeton citri CBS 116435]
MGNSESKSSTSLHNSTTTPHRSGSNKDKAEKQPHSQSNSYDSRRRESLAPSTFSNLSHATTKGTPPTATLISSSSTSTSHDTVTASSVGSHRRQRSATTNIPKFAPFESTEHIKHYPKSDMGNDHSRVRPPSRSATTPAPPTPPVHSEKKELVYRPSSEPKLEDTQRHSPHTAQPVDVPERQKSPPDTETFTPAAQPPLESPYAAGSSSYSRPPRLPIPIEEEVQAPGSPINSTHDLGTAITDNDFDGVIPRRSSMLSTTTADEEDATEDAAFAAEQQQQAYAPTVPTTLEWDQGGDKIYVTGTFVQWERKFKLHRDKERPGVSVATLQLKPGTHHIKFLVDGDMQTSTTLPTTVDYTNILVNYIEVVAPMPQARGQAKPAEPMPIPGAAITRGQAEPTDEGSSRAVEPGLRDLEAAQRDAAHSEVHSHVSTNHHTQKHSYDQSPSPRSQNQPKHPTSQSQQQSQPQQQQQPQKQIQRQQQEPRPRYTSHIPEYFHDLDKYTTPEDESFQRASRVIGHLPPPPSLPMFLSKSILNGTTPHKDDASVLIMPNHTVLNHLATSSIRHGVLATSGTTRYKRKFLTSIMYKPTSDDG